jgi:hypothetical protein
MDHEETPDMVYGRLLEGTNISSYAFERACDELEWLLTGDRWRHVGPGFTHINAFLRSVDFSRFNVQDTRPALVRRIKELQPEASNRAIAQAIGVDERTVRRDMPAAANAADLAPAASVSEEMLKAPAANAAPDAVDADDDEEEVGLPAFLCGDDWSPRERRHAYALYLALPQELQPTVAALLNQPGICVPDRITMLEHIAAMDELQRKELVRLQTSADAYERNCAITFALNRPPPPHPRIMLLYEARRELMAVSRRVEHAAARYPDLPGAAEVAARSARIAAEAHEIEALIDTLRQPEEVTSA